MESPIAACDALALRLSQQKRVRVVFAGQDRLELFLDQLARVVRSTVAMLVSSAAAIRLSA
jgi:hypothetical protein